jgi:hypothetical protein
MLFAPNMEALMIIEKPRDNFLQMILGEGFPSGAWQFGIEEIDDLGPYKTFLIWSGNHIRRLGRMARSYSYSNCQFSVM